MRRRRNMMLVGRGSQRTTRHPRTHDIQQRGVGRSSAAASSGAGGGGRRRRPARAARSAAPPLEA